MRAQRVVPVRTLGRTSGDFRVDHVGKPWMTESFQGGGIEAGHMRLAMETGHEGSDGVPLESRDGAGKFRLEQREVAFLRVLARLRPLIAQRVQARSWLDPSKMID